MSSGIDFYDAFDLEDFVFFLYFFLVKLVVFMPLKKISFSS